MMTTYNSSKNNDEIIVIRDEYKTSLKKKFLKKIKYSLSLNFSFFFLTSYCSLPKVSLRYFHLLIV